MTEAAVDVASAAPEAEFRRPIRGVWWLSPVGAMLMISLPALVYAWSLDDSAYRAAWGAGKVMTAEVFWVFLAGVLTFMLGGAIVTGASRRRPLASPWPAFRASEIRLLQRLSSWLFWGTILGYVLLGGLGYSRGVRLSTIVNAVLTSNTDPGTLKEAFAPIAGVTTFTQFGIALVVICGLLALGGDRRAIVRIGIVVMMSLPRAYLLDERLATLELLVPLLTIFAMGWVSSHRRHVRTAVRMAPLLLLPLLVVVFGFFEYSRSWTFYSTRTTSSFASFAVQRLAGYYVTSYNNGAVFVEFEPRDGRLPFGTIEAFWTAPFIEQANLYQRLSGVDSGALEWDMLNQYVNPEFNNSCGLCTPFVDYGTAGGLLFLFGAGLVIGMLYVRFTRAGPLGLLVYPPLVTGLFEFPRYLYWATGRVLPPLVVLVVTGVVLARRRAAASRG